MLVGVRCVYEMFIHKYVPLLNDRLKSRSRGNCFSVSQKKFDPGDTLTAFSSPLPAAGRFGLGSSEGFVKNVFKRSIVTVASMTLEIVPVFDIMSCVSDTNEYYE